MSETEEQLNKNRELVAGFMGSSMAIIVDSNTTSRSRIITSLAEIGVARSAIEAVGTYEEAEALIRSARPRMVICDYMIGKRSGLELFQMRRALDPDPRTCVLALVTGNSSQSAVAQAAEEDVDAFVLKPYTPENLKKSLVAAVNIKVNPTPYLRVVEAGKDAMYGGELARAMKLFDEATKMEKTPTLAHFYRGQVDLMQQMLNEASVSFKRGLQVNGIHYKCLLGLYELLKTQKREPEAYEVVRKVAKFFPANPKRMADVLRLAVQTSNYPDIEEYYAIFKELDGRSDDLVNYVCSGMAVTGKFYLMSDRSEEAMGVFECVAISCAGRTKFLRYIVEALVEFGLSVEATKFMKRFKGEALESVDFAAVDYLMASCEDAPERQVLAGKKLLRSNVHDPLIYEILISALIATGAGEEAQETAQRARIRYPELNERWDEALTVSAGDGLDQAISDDSEASAA